MDGIYDELTRIAGERSSQKRLELLHKITDLFLEAGASHTDAENYLFNEIMDKIVDQISQEAKVEVSANLATLPGFPASVVRKLANDQDIEIARPVIRCSPSLTETDLVGIAMTGAQEHMHAIASRDRLSSMVTDVLIDRGNQQVVRRVSANHGAEVSPWGFDRLLEKSRQDVDLQELLVERPDLSRDTVEKLLPLLSETLAIKLAERGYDVGTALPPDVLQMARDRFGEALRERKADIRGVAALVELVKLGDLTLDQAIVELTADGRLLDVATLVSRSAGFDLNDTFGLFTRGELQMLMLLFRALELKWSTLEGVLKLRAKKMGKPTPASDQLARDYVALDLSLAQRAIRFMQVRYRLNGGQAEAREVAVGHA